MPSAQLQVAQQLVVGADLALAAAVPHEFFVIKGPVLAETVYRHPWQRLSRDIDIVVRPHEFRATIEALEAQGARLLDANWERAIDCRWGQVHLLMPHGSLIDLHWHLVNAGRVRDTVAIDMRAAWSDLRTVRVLGQEIRTLSVTNTLVHVAMHAALGGAWRRRWFDDIRLTIARERIDWGAAISRARQWRVRRLVGVALARAATYGDADVPEVALDALLAGWPSKEHIARLDRLRSPTQASRESSFARVWPHVTRDRWQDVVRAIGWRIDRRARNGLRGYRYGRDQPIEMMPSGGCSGRSRYLAMVESGAMERS